MHVPVCMECARLGHHAWGALSRVGATNVRRSSQIRRPAVRHLRGGGSHRAAGPLKQRDQTGAPVGGTLAWTDAGAIIRPGQPLHAIAIGEERLASPCAATRALPARPVLTPQCSVVVAELDHLQPAEDGARRLGRGFCRRHRSLGRRRLAVAPEGHDNASVAMQAARPQERRARPGAAALLRHRF